MKTHVVSQVPLQTRVLPSAKQTKIASEVHSLPLQIVASRKTPASRTSSASRKTPGSTSSSYSAPAQSEAARDQSRASAHVQSYFSFPSAGINSINYEYNTQ